MELDQNEFFGATLYVSLPIMDANSDIFTSLKPQL